MEEDMPSPAPRMALYEPGHAIRVRLYRNGDSFYGGRNILIPHKPTGGFDYFLDKVTAGLRPQFGAVRAIYDATTGQQVTALSELQNGVAYVAAGKERFISSVNYSDIPHTIQRVGTISTPSDGVPIRTKRVIKSGRSLKLARLQPVSITVYRNGDAFAAPTKYLFSPTRIVSLEQLCTFLSERMDLAVRRLFNIQGHRVSSLDDVQNGHVFIASSQRKFVKMFYGDGSKPARQAVTMRRQRTLPAIPLERRHYSAPMMHELDSRESPVKRHLPAKPPIGAPQKSQPAMRQRKRKLLVVIPKQSADHGPTVGEEEPSCSETQRLGSVADEPVTTSAVDALKGSALPQIHTAPATSARKAHTYNVTVTTGDWPDSGTDARVFITLVGSCSSSGRRLLSEHAKHFQQGSVDVLAVECTALGDILKINLEQDQSGASSAWYCVSIVVRDTVTNQRFRFPCERWLAADRGDLQTCIELTPAGDTSNLPTTPLISPTDDIFQPSKATLSTDAEHVEDTDETVIDTHVLDLAREPPLEVEDRELDNDQQRERLNAYDESGQEPEEQGTNTRGSSPDEVDQAAFSQDRRDILHKPASPSTFFLRENNKESLTTDLSEQLIDEAKDFVAQNTAGEEALHQPGPPADAAAPVQGKAECSPAILVREKQLLVSDNTDHLVYGRTGTSPVVSEVDVSVPAIAEPGLLQPKFPLWDNDEGADNEPLVANALSQVVTSRPQPDCDNQQESNLITQQPAATEGSLHILFAGEAAHIAEAHGEDHRETHAEVNADINVTDFSKQTPETMLASHDAEHDGLPADISGNELCATADDNYRSAVVHASRAAKEQKEETHKGQGGILGVAEVALPVETGNAQLEACGFDEHIAVLESAPAMTANTGTEPPSGEHLSDVANLAVNNVTEVAQGCVEGSLAAGRDTDASTPDTTGRSDVVDMSEVAPPFEFGQERFKAWKESSDPLPENETEGALVTSQEGLLPGPSDVPAGDAIVTATVTLDETMITDKGKTSASDGPAISETDLLVGGAAGVETQADSKSSGAEREQAALCDPDRVNNTEAP